MTGTTETQSADSSLVRLQIEALRDDVAALYANHGTFHEGDSGLDLFVVEEQTVKAGDTAFIKLGIKATVLKNGKNVSWLIIPRSSICRTPLRQANSLGLIDAGYRGEIMMPVDNIKNVDHTVKRGDRLAQAVAFSGEPLSLEIVPKLDETARGAGGFGSTGKTSQSLDESSPPPKFPSSSVEPSTSDGDAALPATKKLKGETDIPNGESGMSASSAEDGASVTP